MSAIPQLLDAEQHNDFLAWLRLCGLVYKAKGSRPCVITPFELRRAQRNMRKSKPLLGRRRQKYGDLR